MSRFIAAVLVMLCSVAPAVENEPAVRERAQHAFKDRNYLKAYEDFRTLALSAETDAKLVGADLDMAIQCLQLLNRQNEGDALCETAVAAHRENWRLLQHAAQYYHTCNKYGQLIAGEFRRGGGSEGGSYVNAYQHDRVRTLQLMRDGLTLALKDTDRTGAAEFLFAFVDMIQQSGASWRLQTLTDIGTVPDYDEYNYQPWGRNIQGAPVDADGNPIFHRVPASFEQAKTDGERWRWLLSQAAALANDGRAEFTFASFLRVQFDVHTMASYGHDDDEAETAANSLDALHDDETMARLASGIKRFPLPEEFNFISVLKRVEAANVGWSKQAAEALGQIYENRTQYPKAAEHWQRADNKERVRQIVGNWGSFENCESQPAGSAATVEFRFRNATNVHFTAHAIKVEALLEDVKAYLSSKRDNLEWEKVNIDDIGRRIVFDNERQYIGHEAADWQMKLEPRPEHRDRRITITTPLKKAGAYLLTAQLPDGNTSRIVLWLADTVIVKKPLENGQTFIYIADAVSGDPVSGATIALFGWQQQYGQNNRVSITTRQSAAISDADGQTIVDQRDIPENNQWLITATGAGDRFAYLGFGSIWHCGPRAPSPNFEKAFVISDRPVYRPAQKVLYKAWASAVAYDRNDDTRFANKEIVTRLVAPAGEEMARTTVRTDQYGGITGEWTIPADAKLGSYQLFVYDAEKFRAIKDPKELQWQPSLGALSFRVEEYKKPEFEVTVDAPAEPVALGESITATIKATYYFGAPVTTATVHYKVMRTAHDNRWFMPMPWDWLYGRGYAWLGCDHAWYPGWSEWGCRAPDPWWWPGHYQQPELVADSEVAIAADGTVKVVIDTALAKEQHGDSDHSYSITAEVVDQSRRTIVGTGSVIAARKPFSVTTWVDRGYYRVGDTITAAVHAHGADGKPVAGRGQLRLLSIVYEDGKPVEREVQKWDVILAEDGAARQTMKASGAGQFRVTCTVTDAKDRSNEGGQIFVIMGDHFDGAQFHFNDLELISDRADYKPGDRAAVAINSDHAGATVLLFERPSQGVYGKPRMLHLSGKSAIAELTIATADMPNIFVEALTVHDGRVHEQTRELIVPPEDKVLKVTVTPSKDEYLPGAKAEASVSVTGPDGKPFTGAVAISVYDRSLEYISGPSTAGNIAQHFWNWRRAHQPASEHSLKRMFYNLLAKDEIGMSVLGAFGELEVNSYLAAGAGGGNKSRRHASRESQSKNKAGFALFAADGEMQDMAEQEESLHEVGASVEPVVRSTFADTAYWNAQLITDERGQAHIDLTMPDNLTAWKMRAWAFGTGARAGEGTAVVVTKKNVLVRLQAPRFFVEKDEVVLSANVHNYLKQEKTAEVTLELDGSCLELIGKATQSVVISANGEKRVDWRVRVRQEGTAVVRMKALTDAESDAMQQSFPVKVHGMLKMDSFSAAIRPQQQQATFMMTVPAQRRPEQTLLEVRFSPTLAGAMVEALPYLTSYPYGCSEQTLNRFLPTVIAQRVLKDMHIDLADVKKQRANLNAQEIGDAKDRAKRWQRFDENPVFDEAEVAKMVSAGVTALTNMQLSDGGWGWFSGWGERSSAHTTAVVVHGLQIAKENGVAIVPGIVDNGLAWLSRYQDLQIAEIKRWMQTKEKGKQHADDLDAYVYMVLLDADRRNDEMRDFLYRDRPQLSVYALGLFGMALHKGNDREKLAMIMENIAQYLQQDDENQTAWLNLRNENCWWYWYGSEYEAHAYYLKLLAKTDPKSDVAARLVKYLLDNRKHASYWNSTRDTALVIEAIADFMRASGEDKPDQVVEVLIDGKKVHEVAITTANLFTCDNTWRIAGAALASGEHKVEVRKKGAGPLYINSSLSNFTLEDHLTKTGLEIKVERSYYKLIAVEQKDFASGAHGQVVDQKREKYRRELLKDLATVKSGDLIEIELTVDSKNDYEYICLEDMKAAGCEAVDVRSGYNGNALGAYMEVRDDRICLFLRTISRGKHSLSYRVRAEIPGQFSALPTVAQAMYAPELRANSDELKLKIGE
jgi:alpha-2-macroglobulin